MTAKPLGRGICRCGLAWSYHDGTLAQPEEYEPRYQCNVPEHAARVAAPSDGLREAIAFTVHSLRSRNRLLVTPEDERVAVDAIAAEYAAPSDGLREDAGHLADAAVHMADHIASLDIYCEDTSNVRHFAEKVRAARAAATPTAARSADPGGLDDPCFACGLWRRYWTTWPGDHEHRATPTADLRAGTTCADCGHTFEAHLLGVVCCDCVGFLAATPTDD
jgi:hypothetical protein